MEQVRLGIIGLGNMGTCHVETIQKGDVPEVCITAVADRREVRRAWARENVPGAAVFEEGSDLIHSGLCDAVMVVVPHYQHPGLSIEALRAGLHVLCEKPAGVYTKQVREMNEVASASDKTFAIMFNQRTNPLFVRAREIVQSGQLGVPKRLVWIVTNWYRTQAYYDSGSWRATWNGEGGGVLLNQAPHNLDLWQWIFGMPKRVFAFCSFGKYHRIAVEDDVTIQAEYENGASATFITTTGETPGTNRLEISGDRGRLVLENGSLLWQKLAAPEREFCFSVKEGFYQPEMQEERFSAPEPDGHPIILQNFARAILHGEPLIAPGTEGIRSLSISNAAYLSAWTNGWADLPVDEERFESFLAQRREEERLSPRRAVQAEKMSESYQTRWSVRW